MRKILLSIVLISVCCYSFGQDLTHCFNGIKDGSENGVDCNTTNAIGSGNYCQVCNGVASVTLNDKEFNTGAVQTIVSQVTSPSVFNPDRQSALVMIRSTFYTDGSQQSGFTLTFLIDAHPIKVKEYKLQSVLKSEFKCIITYHRSSATMELQKIKSGSFKVISVDNIERKFSAIIMGVAKLADGTPFNLKGTLTNVGY